MPAPTPAELEALGRRPSDDDVLASRLSPALADTSVDKDFLDSVSKYEDSQIPHADANTRLATTKELERQNSATPIGVGGDRTPPTPSFLESVLTGPLARQPLITEGQQKELETRQAIRDPYLQEYDDKIRDRLSRMGFEGEKLDSTLKWATNLAPSKTDAMQSVLDSTNPDVKEEPARTGSDPTLTPTQLNLIAMDPDLEPLFLERNKIEAGQATDYYATETGKNLEGVAAYGMRLTAAPTSAAVGVVEGLVTDKTIPEAVGERVRGGAGFTGAGVDVGRAGGRAIGGLAGETGANVGGYVGGAVGGITGLVADAFTPMDFGILSGISRGLERLGVKGAEGASEWARTGLRGEGGTEILIHSADWQDILKETQGSEFWKAFEKSKSDLEVAQAKLAAAQEAKAFDKVEAAKAEIATARASLQDAGGAVTDDVTARIAAQKKVDPGSVMTMRDTHAAPTPEAMHEGEEARRQAMTPREVAPGALEQIITPQGIPVYKQELGRLVGEINANIPQVHALESARLAQEVGIPLPDASELRLLQGVVTNGTGVAEDGASAVRRIVAGMIGEGKTGRTALQEARGLYDLQTHTGQALRQSGEALNSVLKNPQLAKGGRVSALVQGIRETLMNAGKNELIRTAMEEQTLKKARDIHGRERAERLASIAGRVENTVAKGDEVRLLGSIYARRRTSLQILQAITDYADNAFSPPPLTRGQANFASRAPPGAKVLMLTPAQSKDLMAFKAALPGSVTQVFPVWDELWTAVSLARPKGQGEMVQAAGKVLSKIGLDLDSPMLVDAFNRLGLMRPSPEDLMHAVTVQENTRLWRNVQASVYTEATIGSGEYVAAIRAVDETLANAIVEASQLNAGPGASMASILAERAMVARRLEQYNAEITNPLVRKMWSGLQSTMGYGTPLIYEVETATGNELRMSLTAPVAAAGKGAVGWVYRVMRTGMLSGYIVPNPKFFVNNFVTAPAIVHLTLGPKMAANSLFTYDSWRVLDALGGREYDAGKVLVLSPLGKSYTADDLAQLVASAGVNRSQAAAEFGSRGLEALIADTERVSGGRFKRWAAAGVGHLGAKGENIYAQVANISDNYFRINVLISALREGRSEHEAITLARESLFDYGNVSQFERDWLGKVVWFWTFRRNSYRALFKAALSNPARIRSLTTIAPASRDLATPNGQPDTFTMATSGLAENRPLLAMIEDAQAQQRYGLYGPPIPAVEAIENMVDATSLLFFGWADYSNAVNLAQANGRGIGAGRVQGVMDVAEKDVIAPVLSQVGPDLSGAAGVIFGRDLKRGPDVPLPGTVDPRLVWYWKETGNWETAQNWFHITSVPEGKERPGGSTVDGEQYRVEPDGRKAWYFFGLTLQAIGTNRGAREMAPGLATLFGYGGVVAPQLSNPPALTSPTKNLPLNPLAEKGLNELGFSGATITPSVEGILEQLSIVAGFATPITQPQIEDVPARNQQERTRQVIPNAGQ